VLDALSLDKLPSKHFLNKKLQDKYNGFSPLCITTVNLSILTGQLRIANCYFQPEWSRLAGLGGTKEDTEGYGISNHIITYKVYGISNHVITY